jgi:hypothetical protein
MKKIMFLSILLFLFSCGEKQDCMDAAIVRGDLKLNQRTLDIMNIYKDKKKMVFKNDKGDSLVFNLTFKAWKVIDTF